MYAFPVQHGLSHCMTGSLSEAIGLLPEDKETHAQVCVPCEEDVAVSGGELSVHSFQPTQQQQSSACVYGLSDSVLCSNKELREQSSASQSSSSTDLEEDRCKLQGEQGSLNFQCHSVLPNPSVASGHELVLEHVPCKGEVQSKGELRAISFRPKNLPKTEQTSKHTKELHNTNCTIFPRGCAASQEAKGRALKRASKTKKPRASNKCPQHRLDPHELPQSAWQQSASVATACHEHEEQRRPSAKQASQQQPGRSKRGKKGSRDPLSKLHCSLAKPSSSPAPELANNSASPSHSLLLKLEVSKNVADSKALLSVLGLGRQASSASSFQTAMGEPVATQLSASSVASENLANNLIAFERLRRRRCTRKHF